MQTFTTSSTFTITNARYLASKIAADFYLCSLYYGRPPESKIRDYEQEVSILLRNQYMSKYEFGFHRENKRIVCWRYTIREDGSLITDDSPGKIISSANVEGASIYNFLTFSEKWFELSSEDRERIKNTLPFRRIDGTLPDNGSGYWVGDKNFCSNGMSISRESYRPAI